MQLAPFSKLPQFNSQTSRLIRTLLLAVTGMFLLSILSVQANAETRTLRMYYGHSKESATITFKKNGKYLKSGLRKANRFLRDWRRKEPTRMDPALLDLVWEVYQKSGSRKPIQVISGYRSPRTNKMLRRRGRKVARNSQHTRGKALDFFLPDVSVTKLRALGLKAHRGGVGYYRGSFVHLDTGRVRHWPRMSRRQLSRVFPRGKTIHVPRSGRPLSGYKTAMRNLKKGRNADGSRRRTTVNKSLIANIFKPAKGSGEGDERKVVAGKPEKKKPTKIARAKVKGPDPFSQDSNAVSKAEAKKIAEERKKLEAEKQLAAQKLLAEKAKKNLEEQRKRDAEEESRAIALADATATKLAAAEAARTASIVPTQVTTPRLRPAATPSTQLALAAPDTQDQSSVLKSVGATELALARPAALGLTPADEVLLPPNPSIASVATPVAAPSANRTSKADALATKAKQLLVAQSSLNKQAEALAERTRKQLLYTTPATSKKPEGTQLAALVPWGGQKTARITKPSLRSTPQKGVAKTETSSPIVLPTITTPKNQFIAVNTNGAKMRNELKLGDLDGKSVKKWAVAVSTRTGDAAALRAPIYKQGTRRAAPLSVYSGGFAFHRSPLRSDRFSGRALTRVAFAHFASRN